MSSKLCSLKEAIADTVKEGNTLVIEGFTHLICHAAGHEIIRQNIKNLTLARMTPDLVYDQMIAADLCKKIIFSWIGNPGVGSLHAFRRRSEAKYNNPIEIEEYSHGGMMTRLQAGANGLPFGVIDSFMGSDISKYNSNIKEITCPYTGRKFATVPALNPDVCVVHVQRADIRGNGQVWGLMGTQKESAFASKKVVLVAEEIVDSSVIRSDPNRTLIPETVVTHVCHVPWGCHPSYAQGYYDRDNDFYVEWDTISRDPEGLKKFLDEFVYGCKDHSEYMKKLGEGKMQKLKAKPRVCAGVDYGY
jgi:glutaconate CoA-transferase subunit A